MPRWKCSYAYDVSCYRDFVVEAETEAEAEKIADQALKDGKFSSVSGVPCWDSSDNDRVFTGGLDESGDDPTLDEVIKECD